MDAMELAGRSVLVTGGCGLVGRALTRALVAEGCDVRVFDRCAPPPDARATALPAGIALQIGDLRDEAALARALDGVELVFHQAALTPADAPSADFLDVNATGTARLFEIIARRKLPVRRVVVASSLGVYGEGKYRCASCGIRVPRLRSPEQLRRHDWEPRCTRCDRSLEALATDEATPATPVTPYAIAKLAGERLALALGERGEVPTVALRYAVVYGPGQSLTNPYSGVIAAFAKLILRGEAPALFEDGKQRRDWIFVDDVVRANLFAMRDARTDFEAWNVGSGVGCTVTELAERLARALGSTVAPRVSGAFRVGDYRHLVLETSRLTQLGFVPQISLDAGLERFARWLVAQGEQP